ncbi:hypothetical protein OG474_43755 [Kribbella sp. NBC_01505]|uniref:hypothetical protein n=1 Tax=Kribbella sp. NBC_01505 TaxID=2903580 RepID=UPI003863E867
MNSTWLPFALAFLSGFFALAGSWLTGAQARRRESRDRDARRTERRYEVRNEVYTNLVLQVDAFAITVDRAPALDELASALAGLNRLTVPVAFQSREIAAGPLKELVVLAERLAGPLARSAASNPDRIATVADYAAARAVLLDALSRDLDRYLW